MGGTKDGVSLLHLENQYKSEVGKKIYISDSVAATKTKHERYLCRSSFRQVKLTSHNNLVNNESTNK